MSKEEKQGRQRDTSHYFHHASAYGVAGKITRPLQLSIPVQAATTLPPGGGTGHQRIEGFRAEGVVSFKSATVDVGGSFDPKHQLHASYASAVIEDLNISDIVKADKVVARLAIYSRTVEGPGCDDQDVGPSFDITGSHFENLRICGHLIDVKLATNAFHQRDTYDRFDEAYQQKKVDDLLFWNGLVKLKENELQALECRYHALEGISTKLDRWIENRDLPRKEGWFWCSAANHLKLEEHTRGDSELQGFGCMIFVPKFGIVRLAELIITKHYRSLNMVRVDMCSTGDGQIHGGGAGGGGGTMPPPP